MTPHVVLLADAGPGIGWGHAVRQLALAEALVAQKCRVLFVTRTKKALTLDWPCPVWEVFDVEKAELPEGAVLVYDMPDQPLEPEGFAYRGVVRFADYGPPANYWDGDPDYLVCPNFAATSHEWHGPAFLGPRWAPLRRPFNWTGVRDPSWLTRNAGNDEATVFPLAGWGGFDAHCVARMMAASRYALVSPSMVALECLAVGVPVVLTVPGPKWQPIADAMVAAGVAVLEGPEGIEAVSDPTTAKAMSERGRDLVDGRGARRLAEWLADA